MALKHALETIHLGDGWYGKAKVLWAKLYFRTGFKHRTFTLPLRFHNESFPFLVSDWVDMYSLHSIFVAQEFDVLECDSAKTILDLGGNIGASAVFFLVRYPEAHVYVAEPSPLLQEKLRLNLKHFGDRATILSYAFWNTDGEQLHFDCAPHKHLSGSLHTATGADTVLVETLRLDSFQAQYEIPTIDILKYNVEGAEWQIFSTWTPSRVRYLIGEFHPDLCGHSFEDFVNYFASSHQIVADSVSRKGRHFTKFIPRAS